MAAKGLKIKIVHFKKISDNQNAPHSAQDYF